MVKGKKNPISIQVIIIYGRYITLASYSPDKYIDVDTYDPIRSFRYSVRCSFEFVTKTGKKAIGF